MPLEIEVPEKRATELATVIRERDEIVKKAQEQVAIKNALISVMLSARLEIAGHDPDVPRAEASMQVRDGKHFLVIPDSPTP